MLFSDRVGVNDHTTISGILLDFGVVALATACPKVVLAPTVMPVTVTGFLCSTVCIPTQLSIFLLSSMLFEQWVIESESAIYSHSLVAIQQPEEGNV
jgi:hypothetical protein